MRSLCFDSSSPASLLVSFLPEAQLSKILSMHTLLVSKTIVHFDSFLYRYTAL